VNRLSKIAVASLSCTADAAVGWFGALVLLMGWIETRKFGRLDTPEVEGWLIADVCYALLFYRFVEVK
jgi:hypothetical protein